MEEPLGLLAAPGIGKRCVPSRTIVRICLLVAVLLGLPVSWVGFRCFTCTDNPEWRSLEIQVSKRKARREGRARKSFSVSRLERDWEHPLWREIWEQLHSFKSRNADRSAALTTLRTKPTCWGKIEPFLPEIRELAQQECRPLEPVNGHDLATGLVVGSLHCEALGQLARSVELATLALRLSHHPDCISLTGTPYPAQYSLEQLLDLLRTYKLSRPDRLRIREAVASCPDFGQRLLEETDDEAVKFVSEILQHRNLLKMPESDLWRAAQAHHFIQDYLANRMRIGNFDDLEDHSGRIWRFSAYMDSGFPINFEPGAQPSFNFECRRRVRDRIEECRIEVSRQLGGV